MREAHATDRELVAAYEAVASGGMSMLPGFNPRLVVEPGAIPPRHLEARVVVLPLIDVVVGDGPRRRLPLDEL